VTRRRPRAAELTRHSDLKCAEDKQKGKLMEKLRSTPAVIAASALRLQILSDDGKTAVSQQRTFWIPVICGAVILTIGIGARQSFGIFQKPIARERIGHDVT